MQQSLVQQVLPDFDLPLPAILCALSIGLNDVLAGQVLLDSTRVQQEMVGTQVCGLQGRLCR
jgi:hypothetical protein